MLVADYHTHTTYSHGKGSVLDNAMYAKKMGLKSIAITDHGFGHIAFGIKRKEVAKLRADIDKAIRQTGVNIYLGIEANIRSFNGDVDVKKSDFDSLQLLVVGFHNFVKAPILEWCRFVFGNVLANLFKIVSKRRIKRNTQAYIKALNRYPIDIISHLNYTCRVDCYEVAKACEQTNTYIELNGKRVHFSKKDVEDMLKTNVKFVINSDAHKKERVGDAGCGIEMAKMYGIPLDRIVNLHEEIIVKSKTNFEDKV